MGHCLREANFTVTVTVKIFFFFFLVTVTVKIQKSIFLEIRSLCVVRGACGASRLKAA
jgi:hypothetical protein